MRSLEATPANVTTARNPSVTGPFQQSLQTLPVNLDYSALTGSARSSTGLAVGPSDSTQPGSVTKLDPTVAIDSINGNDSNPGTLLSPKRSLQQPTTVGSVFGLFRGSLFRDSLPFTTLGNTHDILVEDVAPAGSGPLPIISALDPVPNGAFVSNGDGTYSYTWTGESTLANDGYANVYVVEIATATEGNQPVASRRRMLDASGGEVAGTPGTVEVELLYGSTYTAILHPSDSLPPGSGAYHYEVVVRNSPANWGAPNNFGDGAMTGVQLVGSSDGYGSLGAPASFAGDRMAFMHCTTHCAVIGSGSLARSVFYELGDTQSIQLAWYTADPTGLSWAMNNCLFYANVGDREANCLIAHSSSGSNYVSGNISDCAFLGTRRANGALQGTAIDFNNVATGVIESVYVHTIASIFGGGMPLSTEVKNSVFQEVAFPRVGLYFHDNLVLAESAQDPASNANAPAALLLQQNGANASNNLLWAHGLGGYTQGNSDQASGIQTNGVTVATIQHNIIILDPANQTVPSSYLTLPAGAPTGLSMDYNLVISTAKGGINTLGGTGNTSGWTGYQAAYPTLDAHSLFVDLSADPRGLKAIFVDPLNGDFRWAQTDLAVTCAAYCRANKTGTSSVSSRWPIVPTIDAALQTIAAQ